MRILYAYSTVIIRRRAEVPNLSLTMHPFSISTDKYVPFTISTDEHVPLKLLMTKYFIMIFHKCI